jgi:homoserine O-succinyltransferase/O-acetyltransferase
MPVHLDLSPSDPEPQASASRQPTNPSPEPEPKSSQPLTIGLVNNMPETAFKATEQQFLSLLNAASEGIPIRLSFYALPGLSKTETSGPSGYANVETLRGTRLDGLIVTGREPTTADLRDEPYWGSFVEVLEWAQHNTHSTMWSCLAAHAAVLHLDGISRRKSEDKHCGIFECTRLSNHWLTAGVPAHFQVPHSRWNGIADAELAARGYEVLARTANGEVDTFVKQGKGLFVFFQGHPEYEPDTLLREYRRDVGRYLRREADTYPEIPRNYFDGETETTLKALRERAISSRGKDLLANLATMLENRKIKNTWHSTATLIYRNWLEYLRAQKNANHA